MKDLPIYKNLAAKENHFQCETINTIEEFHNLVNRISNSKGIFRGINEAKYKIYTSLQRQIITRELNSFDLEKYVRSFRNIPLLRKYFKTFKIEPSKLSVYSYLQHYGAPTPFLDFTTDFRKAIYFGIENFDSLGYTPNKTIDDYFSLFQITQDNLELIEIPNVIRDLKKVKELSIQATSHYQDYNEDLLIENIDQFFKLNTCNIFLIDQREEFVEIYNTYNNIRIVAQDGLFIHNNYEDTPLEEGLKDFLREATRYKASALDEVNDPRIQEDEAEYLDELDKNIDFQKRLEKNIIKSYNINKVLIPEIKNLISLEKDDIYPRPENLCWNIFEQELKEDL